MGRFGKNRSKTKNTPGSNLPVQETFSTPISIPTPPPTPPPTPVVEEVKEVKEEVVETLVVEEMKEEKEVVVETPVVKEVKEVVEEVNEEVEDEEDIPVDIIEEDIEEEPISINEGSTQTDVVVDDNPIINQVANVIGEEAVNINQILEIVQNLHDDLGQLRRDVDIITKDNTVYRRQNYRSHVFTMSLLTIDILLGTAVMFGVLKF